jgi:hypothetical protein
MEYGFDSIDYPISESEKPAKQKSKDYLQKNTNRSRVNIPPTNNRKT